MQWMQDKSFFLQLYHSLNTVLTITGITTLENNTLPLNDTVSDYLRNWNNYRINFVGKWTGRDVDVLLLWVHNLVFEPMNVQTKINP